jgi:threonine dehydrogenase-like Zn-dependent dehydrogenase
MQAAEIVNSGQVHLRDLVSQRFPLAQAVAAFAAAQDYKSLKVVLEP